MTPRGIRAPRDLAVALGATCVVLAGTAACRPPTPPRPVVEPPAPVVALPTPIPRRDTYLVLKLKERRLYLMKEGGTELGSYPIAIGRPGRETPTGEFRVEDMIENPDFHQLDPKDKTRVLKHFPPGPQNPLGQRWMQITHGPGWTLGIHGTPRPELLGQAVSGGCIRMRNADVVQVFDQVELGTPVFVHP